MKTITNTQQSPNAETLWDANDVAGFLKVSRSWVYQNAAAGLLPCLKIRGLLRFSPSAVRAWALEPHSPSS
jgi:predicted DNA-binding transcriptional regulator AlpA